MFCIFWRKKNIHTPYRLLRNRLFFKENGLFGLHVTFLRPFSFKWVIFFRNFIDIELGWGSSFTKLIKQGQNVATIFSFFGLTTFKLIVSQIPSVKCKVSAVDKVYHILRCYRSHGAARPPLHLKNYFSKNIQPIIIL